MEKTLVRFLGGAAMVCGALVGLPASAHAQSVSFDIVGTTSSGPARQMVGPQVIKVTNSGQEEATGVTVTFSPPKGAKVDSACQVDHLPGGYRSYTCSVGSLTPGQSIEITFSISMTASGDVGVEVTCDQPVSAGALLSITIL